MAAKKPNAWFSKAEDPKPKPDLLDPRVSPKDAYRDDQITGASPELGGEPIDPNDRT